MTTFQYFKKIKKDSVKTLIEHGYSARNAFKKVESYMPYLFSGKKYLDSVDNQRIKKIAE